MAEVQAPISLDGVAVHLDCWCVCLCYLHFAPENPEDGEMHLLVLAHPGCPGQSSAESRKMVVLCVLLCNKSTMNRSNNVLHFRSGVIVIKQYTKLN